MSAPSPQHLLDQARHLATKETGTPEQVSLRRAVSASYYALFHLLVHDAATLLGGGDEKLEMLIARAFSHADMAQACSTFATSGTKPTLIDAVYGSPLGIPSELRRVAQAFRDLQTARHDADYATHRSWSRTEALTEVERAEEAFKDWDVIRPGPAGAKRPLSLDEQETVRLFLASLVLLKRMQAH